eukprot:1159928-Pelagomonas_calceolata.AAC.10
MGAELCEWELSSVHASITGSSVDEETHPTQHWRKPQHSVLQKAFQLDNIWLACKASLASDAGTQDHEKRVDSSST